MLNKFAYGLIIALLSSACSTVIPPKPPVVTTPEKTVIRNTPGNVQTKSESSTQEGGAQQGVILSLKNQVSTIAGKVGVPGAEDGSPAKAHFNLPQGITSDGSNLYVADLNNHTIRKVDIANGVVSTIAGLAGKKGSADGKGSVARFNRPFGITTDGEKLFVTDSNNHSVRQIVIDTGKVTTLAGRAGEEWIRDWPSQSPDLAIIENLWSILLQRLEGRQVKTASGLWRALKEEWETLDATIWRKLGGSWEKRMQLVVAAEGGPIKY